ncbi:Ldh family oxidoreductase, partial [Candidatus Poribacteria bacterium]|nr:Ldh family oxidoreductase [Candidatus Poribacteria bacterium]
MPTFQPDNLRQIGYDLFEAAGCTAEDTRSVVDHLIESNLFGHDSHGAIRFYEYARAIRDGRFQPTAKPEIVSDNPCAAVVDGHSALGQVGATFAMNLAIEKAR